MPATFEAITPSLTISGQPNSSINDDLISLCVMETSSGLYRCEVVLRNWGVVGTEFGYLYFNRQLVDFGKPLTVKIGTNEIFSGRVTGLEADYPEASPPQITILAEDRLQDLRMVRRTRTFENLSDAAVIRQIAGDHGLTPNIQIAGGPAHSILAQVNQSDLAFLRERARAVDAELWMAGSTLQVSSYSNRGGQAITLEYGDKLRQFSVLADLAGQRTSVAVNGWDVTSKTAIQFEAGAASLNGELNGGASGASILSSAFGQRKEAIVHTVPLTSQEAQAQAEAYFKMTARQFLTGKGLAETDAQLRVGAYVTLEGLGRPYTGRYYLSEVHHFFDNVLGFRTEFRCERAGIGY